MTNETKKCDICLKEQDRHIVGWRGDKWICTYCTHEDFKAKHELISTVHNSEDTSIVIDDYPYGFRLRTKIRYWIETTKRGDRFVSQTLNPKTNVWNKTKKSTYADIGVLIKEKATGYTSWSNWSIAYENSLNLNLFLSFVGKFPLNENQKNKIIEGRAVYKTREHFTVEIVKKKFRDVRTGEIVTSFSVFDCKYMEEIGKEENEKEQAEVKKEINRTYQHYLYAETQGRTD